MKRHASTIVLLLLAAALGLWLWLGREQVTEDERRSRDTSVFPVWRREALSRVLVAHEGETIVLERDPKADAPWRMTSPRDERVDVGAVERLLMALELATVARKASEDGALGLDAPRATGEVHMGAVTMRFALGGESPRPAGSGYLRVDDGGPVVVTKELVAALLASSDTLRDRTVVPYLSLELAKVEVKRGDDGFALAREGDRPFELATRGVLASRRAVDAVWSALAEMRAEAFPPDADGDALTAKPRLVVVLTPKDASKPAAELVVGAACPGHPDDVVVLRRAPTRVVACAPRGAVEALEVPASSFVDPHPVSARMDEIEELRLEWLGPPPPAGDDAKAPRAIEIARKGTGFKVREPSDRDLSAEESDAATELLGRIADAEADAVTAKRDAGEAAFSAVARARVRAGEQDLVVEIGAPRADGRVTLRRLADGALLDVPVAVARRFVPRETSLRPRKILEGETRRPARVILRCGVPQELVDRGDGFRMESPAGYEADGTILQLVEAVLRGRVDAWVADVDDGSFGIEGDGCRVVVAFEDGASPATLAFGARGEGGVYGRVSGRAGVFVASPALLDMASRVYVTRAAMRVPAAAIAGVTGTLRGAPVELELERARAAIDGLVADRVLAIGPAASRLVASPDLVIDVTLEDAGAKHRVICRAPGPGEVAPVRGREAALEHAHRDADDHAHGQADGHAHEGAARRSTSAPTWTCAVAGRDVAYAVLASRVAAFVGPEPARDGGGGARDGGR